MEGLEIAKAEAKILHRLSNWGFYSSFDDSYDPAAFVPTFDPEELQLAKLEGRKQELARSRAAATRREFAMVLAEVELEVMIHLARILAISNELPGLKSTRIEECVEVCGVCQDEMEIGEEGKAMECKHMFHQACIVKWLETKKTCPLCRHQLQIKDCDF